jgi:hypothetical protein
MKNAVFWDVAPCRYCVNGSFGEAYRLHLQGRKIRERGTSVSRWLQPAVYNVYNVRRLLIFSLQNIIITNIIQIYLLQLFEFISSKLKFVLIRFCQFYFQIRNYI